MVSSSLIKTRGREIAQNVRNWIICLLIFTFGGWMLKSWPLGSKKWNLKVVFFLIYNVRHICALGISMLGWCAAVSRAISSCSASALPENALVSSPPVDQSSALKPPCLIRAVSPHHRKPHLLWSLQCLHAKRMTSLCCETLPRYGGFFPQQSWFFETLDDLWSSGPL